MIGRLFIITAVAAAALVGGAVMIGRGLPAEVVAFQSNADGRWTIHVLDVGRGTRHQLTSGDSHNEAPAWSPDGERLAFHSTRNGLAQIFVYTLGGGTVQVTHGSRFQQNPAWSPDGAQIVAECSILRGESGLCVVNSRGGPVTRLTVGNDLHPQWSPDGSAIYYVRATRSPQNELRVELHRLDLATGQTETLFSANLSFAMTFALAPDETIVLSMYDGDIRRMRLYSLHTSGAAQPLTGDGGSYVSPAWMPGRRGVVISSDRDGEDGLYIFDLTTGESTRIAHTISPDTSPSWRPR